MEMEAGWENKTADIATAMRLIALEAHKQLSICRAMIARMNVKSRITTSHSRARMCLDLAMHCTEVTLAR